MEDRWLLRVRKPSARSFPRTFSRIDVASAKYTARRDVESSVDVDMEKIGT